MVTDYIDIGIKGNGVKFAQRLANMLKSNLKGRELVLLCVGTDRATGDALGPLTGTRLEKSGISNVFGTLENPVHALNLQETISYINRKFHKPFILALDASLGKNGHIGCVTLSSEPLHPGSGVEKELGSVGSLSVTGIVNNWSLNSFSVLQSTRLSLVVKMSDFISDGILYAVNEINNLTKHGFSRIM
jgi:putative sporulation protein YyaC